MNSRDAFEQHEFAYGQLAAQAFIDRLQSGEPCEPDALAQTIATARLASPERARAVIGAIQQRLAELLREVAR